MSHHLMSYVTSSYVICHIILCTCMEQTTAYVTSSYVICHIILCHMSHHLMSYVTSSYVICHIILCHMSHHLMSYITSSQQSVSWLYVHIQGRFFWRKYSNKCWIFFLENRVIKDVGIASSGTKDVGIASSEYKSSGTRKNARLHMMAWLQ